VARRIEVMSFFQDPPMIEHRDLQPFLRRHGLSPIDRRGRRRKIPRSARISELADLTISRQPEAAPMSHRRINPDTDTT